MYHSLQLKTQKGNRKIIIAARVLTIGLKPIVPESSSDPESIKLTYDKFVENWSQQAGV